MTDRFNGNGYGFPKADQKDNGGFRSFAKGDPSLADRDLDLALQALHQEVLAEPVPRRLIDIVERYTHKGVS